MLWIWTNAVDVCRQLFVWTYLHSLGNIPRIPGESCLIFSGIFAFSFKCQYNSIISFIPWVLLTASRRWQIHFCEGTEVQSTQRIADNKDTICTECQHMASTRQSDLTAVSHSILLTALWSWYYINPYFAVKILVFWTSDVAQDLNPVPSW